MAQKFHPTSRGQIAYDKRGLGDPLLLVHGIYPGASHEEFHRNLRPLSDHFTIYAIDLLGFGDSEKPNITYTAQLYEHLLRDFIIEVIGQATHVMASGTSCGPATALAVYNHALVGKLVLIDPGNEKAAGQHPPTVAARLQQFLLGRLSMGVGLYETMSSRYELKQFLRTRYSNPRHVTDQRVAELHERASRRHAMYPYISYLTGHLATDVIRWLRYVPNQVLILWGSDAGPPPADKLLPPAGRSNDRRIEIIPQAAHWPHDEQSAMVNRIVIEFLYGT
ncbi:MAG TPA: alpha/beta fold hydrolase [Tepidisphaeraceae bacterium]|nr:alpha/beta fold hydrolase [Tepidisphaeraceae bacterium]